MRKITWLASLIVSFLLISPSTSAQNSLSSITQANASAPGEPVCLGDNVTYSVQVTGPDYIGGITWYYRWTGCTPDAAEIQWTNGNGSPVVGPYIYTMAKLLGSFEMRATTTCNDGHGGASYTISSPTATFSYLPPDNAVLATPATSLNTDFDVEPEGSVEPDIIIAFNVRRGSRLLPNCGGEALEHVDRAPYDPTAGGPDYPWGTAPFLIGTAGAILDGKGVNDEPGFQILNPGDSIDTFKQTIGLRLPTGCGTTQDVTLGTFNFEMVKSGVDTWQLQEF